MNMADELVAQGGPSAPGWIFLTTITLAVIANLFQTVKTKTEAREATKQAKKSAANTENVSNGFVGKVDRQLDRIIRSQDRLESSQDQLAKALREHLEWHLKERAKPK